MVLERRLVGTSTVRGVLYGYETLLVTLRVEYRLRHFKQDRQFYIHGSVLRHSVLIRSNDMQQYAGIYLLQNYSTCFGCLSHLSSGVHQTVTAASSTGHITYQGNDLLPAWPKVVALIRDMTCTRSCSYSLMYS